MPGWHRPDGDQHAVPGGELMSARILLVPLTVCAALSGCGSGMADPRDNRPNTTAATTTLIASTVPDSDEGSDSATVAAVRFVCSGQLLLDTPPGQLAEVIRDLWTESAADAAITDTVAQLVDLRDQLAAGRGATRYRQSVISTRVESTTPSEATVSLWWIGVLSRDGAALPQAQWSTSRITLVLDDGRWKVSSQSTVRGPTPDHSSDAEPLSTTELERSLDGFVDWEANR